MNHWNPPQVGGTPEIPVTEVKAPTRWWKRRYRRVPVWGWAAGGLVALSALSAAVPPNDSDRLAIVDGAVTTTAAVDEIAEIESTALASTSAPSTTTTAPVITNVTTLVVALPDPTTTAPPSTTTRPTTIPAITLPPTTTTPPPPPPPPPPAPAPTTVAIQPFIPTNDCDPNYTGCVPIDSDVDCAGGSGNGPSYARGPVTVIGSDIYELDGDADGIGCE